MTLSTRPLILAMALASFGSVAQTVDLGPGLSQMQRFQIYPRIDKAFEAIAQGDGKRAIAELQQAQKLAPDNSVITLYLADAHRRFGQSAQAEAVLKEQLKRYPGDARLAKALNDLKNSAPLPKPNQVAAAQPTPAQPSEKTQGPPNAAPTTSPATALASPPTPGRARSSSSPRTKPSARRVATRTPEATQAPLPNPGYTFADKAYAEVARSDLAAALPLARQAAQAAPDQLDYQRLLVYLLIENRQYEEAQARVAQLEAQSMLPATDPEWQTLKQQARQRSAFKHFDTARKSRERGDLTTALREAEEGANEAPDVLAHRLQWVGILLQSGDQVRAQQVAEQGLAQHDSPPLRALLGAALQAQQRSDESAQAFETVLAAPGLTEQERTNYRLIAADAALAARRPERARALLAPLAAGDDQAIAGRQSEIQSALRRVISPASLYAPTFRLPAVNCFGSDHTPGCEVWPGQNMPDPAQEVAQQAYQAYSARNYALAAQKAQEAGRINPAHLPYQLLRLQALAEGGQMDLALQESEEVMRKRTDVSEVLALRSRLHHQLGQEAAASADAQAALQAGNLSLASEIDMLLQLGQREEAASRLSKALEESGLKESDDPDLGYLAIRVGDDKTALDVFDRARAGNRLPATSLRDGAYAASRQAKNDQAIEYFQSAIDAADSGQLELTPQQLFATRREVADRTRSWGANTLLGYRGIAPGTFGAAQPGLYGDVAQLVVEGYWRPQKFGDGRFWELYAGVAQTVYSKDGGPTGSDTTQGTIGVRVKPLANHNLVLSAERRIRIGSLAINDWLLRAGYSGGIGTDLRVDVPNWTTVNFYAEAGRFLQRKQNYATFEAQAGRSFRMGDADSRLVLFPHVVLGVDYNSARTTVGYNGAAGAGIGIGMRYWFREDRHNAPRSYLDLSLQYRARLMGDERGKGVFLRAALVF